VDPPSPSAGEVGSEGSRLRHRNWNDDFARDRCRTRVVLVKELLQCLLGGGAGGEGEGEPLPPDEAPRPHDEDRAVASLLVHRHGHRIEVHRLGEGHRLPLPDPLQGVHGVAEARCVLEPLLASRPHHLEGEVLHHLLHPALKEERRRVHCPPVLLRAH